MKPHPSPANGAPPNLAGTRAGPLGRYLLLHEIARGGMGAVYRATDEQFGRALAVKVLLADPRQRPDLVHRFQEEARISGQLQHPGVPPVHEAGTLPDGRPFLAMKLIEGQTLAEHFAARPSAAHDQARLLAVFEQVCQTIAYAHNKGVVHRDLKPANIMVGAFGEVQVMDWGLAWQRAPQAAPPDAPTAHQAELTVGPLPGPDGGVNVLGTPAYMAPERARGEPGDERADVFGLGAILCELLTGLSPYAASSAPPLVRLLAGSTDEALRRLGPSAPPDLAALVCRCLSPEPAGRPASGSEVAAALTAHLAAARERLQRAEIDRARAEQWAAQEGKRRWLVLAAAVLLVGLAACAALVYAWHREQQAWEQADQAHAARAAEKAERDALSRAESLAARRRWRQALAALAPLEDGLSLEARRLQGALRLALELRRARLASRMLFGHHRAAPVEAPAAAVLARHGLALDRLTIEQLARRLKGSPALLEALSDLYEMLLDDQRPKEASRLEALLRLIDPSPWRLSVLRVRKRGTRRALEALAERLPASWQPPGAVSLLADALRRAGGDDLAFRRRVQARFPNEFWYSFDLAVALSSRAETLPEAAGRMRAALALRPQCAACWNNLGVVLYRARQYAAAREALQRAVQAGPGLHLPQTNLALVLYREGKPNKAAETVKAVLDAEPNDADALLVQGIVLAPQDTGQAASSLLEALRVRRDDAEAWARLALTRQLEGRLHDAEVAAGRAVQISPEGGPALFARALLWAEQGRFLEAARALDRPSATLYFDVTAALRRARELCGAGADAGAAHLLGLVLAHRPNNALALKLVPALLRRPRGREALRVALERASARHPQRPALWAYFGRAAKLSGRADEADRARRHLARLRPASTAGQVELGAALQLVGDTAGARDVLFRAHGLAPSNPAPPFALAQLFLDTTQYRLAEDTFAHAARRGLNVPAALAGRARAVALQKRPGEALRLTDEALRKYPTDAQLLGLRARLLLDARRTEEALQALRAAAKAAPTSPGPLLALAEELERRKRPDQATVQLKMAAELAPESPLPAYRLGLLSLGARDYAEAARHFAAASRLAPQKRAYRAAWADALTRRGDFEAARGLFPQAALFYRDALTVLPRAHFARAGLEVRLGLLHLLELLRG